MVLSDDYKERYSLLQTMGFNSESHLYIVNDSLCKIYVKTIDLPNREYYVDKLMKLNYINNAIWPQDKIYISGKFSGIVMEYKRGFENLANIFKTLSFENAITMGIQLSQTLKQIHEEGFIIGDIHGDNIITNRKEFCFCDLDGMKCDLNNTEAKTLYSIMYNDYSPSISDNQMTDNIKLLTYILSVLYHYNLESELANKGTEFLLKLVCNLNLPMDIKNIMMNIFNLGIDQPYFYEYSSLLSNSYEQVEYDRQRIAKKVKILY